MEKGMLVMPSEPIEEPPAQPLPSPPCDSPLLDDTSNNSSSSHQIQPTGSPKEDSSAIARENGEGTSSEPDELEDNKDDEDFVVFTNKFKKKNRSIPKASPNSKKSKKKRICEFCGASDTPMWRRGPQGKGTLCNACGVKWSLKFRKRAGKKKEGKESPREKKNFRKSVRRENSNNNSNPGSPPLNGSPVSSAISPVRSPFMGSPGRIAPLSPVQQETEELKEYFCKYCCSRWPLGYFKNTQQFGAHCSNCSRKPKQEENEIGLKREANETWNQNPREVKRKKENPYESESSGLEDQISDCEINSSGDNLLGRLLNVVENKLLEETSIEEIRQELNQFRGKVLLKEDEVLNNLKETKSNLMNEVLELKKEITELFSFRETKITSSIQEIGNEAINDLKANTNVLKNYLQNIRTTLNGHISIECASKIEIIEATVMAIQSNMENNFELMKTKVGTEIQQIRFSMMEGFTSKQDLFDTKVQDIKKHSIKFLDQAKQKLDDMESVLDSN